MKQLVLLISLFLFAGSVTGFAQTTKEQIKERKRGDSYEWKDVGKRNYIFFYNI